MNAFSNDSEASVMTSTLAETAGTCLSAVIVTITESTSRRELCRSGLESARARHRKRSVFGNAFLTLPSRKQTYVNKQKHNQRTPC